MNAEDQVVNGGETAKDKEDEPSDDTNKGGGMWPPPSCVERNLALGQIQGNSIGGFNKDSQAMLFLRITGTDPNWDSDKARLTLGGDKSDPEGPHDIIADVCASTSEQVLRFNSQFKALKSEGVPEGLISATWTNLVVTPGGMRKLGVPDEELDLFPDTFKQGMAARADKLGDVGASEPAHWDQIVKWDDVDIVLIVASDDPEEVDGNNAAGRVGRYLARILAPDSGLELAVDSAWTFGAQGQIYGATRSDQPGHEHFGFKDGVSQPGIRGVNPPDDPIGNPNQGHPGQDLLHPGEFILGYPRQRPAAKEQHDGPNPDPGIISGSGKFYEDADEAIDPPGSRNELPFWVDNGSFLVFRRLEQDVFGFRQFVEQTSQALKMTPDLFGAKLVGRYRSGAPLEKRTFQAGDDETYEPPLHDPGVPHPALADSDSVNNNFEFGDDKEGEIVPMAAHIRKAYPRDQFPELEFGRPTDLEEDDAESRTQTHRLLRRGIPYGPSLNMENAGGNPYEKRGLLFLAYQTDIERQFEFVQRAWVNDENFPKNGAGQDPILSQRTNIPPSDPSSDPATIQMCPFRSAAAKAAGQCPIQVNIQHFITTRGGGYYFSPSIDTLLAWWKGEAATQPELPSPEEPPYCS